MSQNHKQHGFTVIELTLAMAFLAFIMIFTTTVMVQMMRTYNKGLTIKQINQAGRTITDDLSRSLSSGVPAKINTDYIPQGRLCVGNYVYVWTPTYDSTTHDYKNITYVTINGSAVGLARIPTSPLNCSGGVGFNYNTSSPSVVPLLSTQARVLDVKVEKYGAGDRLVTLSFIIGTYDASEATTALPSLNTATPQYGNIYITPYYDSDDKMTCRPGDDGNFCSFATFKTTVYVGN